MARQYKRLICAYPAYCYKQEIEELNKKSEQGWHLIKGGVLLKKYNKNPDVRYRYQLDYSGKVEDLGRYIETFREQGWEYINTTVNGWSYFRKLWDANLSEEQYEIFTDKSSLQEMTGRWMKIAAILAILETILLFYFGVHVVRTPTLPTIIRFAICLFFALILVRGIFLMKSPKERNCLPLEKVIFITVFALAMVLVVFPTYLDIIRPNFGATYFADGGVSPIPAELDHALEWVDLDFPYSDNYYVDINIEADSPICFSIVDDSDEAVYTVTESSVSIKNMKLHMDKGNYRIYFSDYEGGQLNISVVVK